MKDTSCIYTTDAIYLHQMIHTQSQLKQEDFSKNTRLVWNRKVANMTNVKLKNNPEVFSRGLNNILRSEKKLRYVQKSEILEQIMKLIDLNILLLYSN